MPELPEVETVARQLQHVLPGEEVTRLVIKDKRLAVARPNKLRGYVIRRVERMGKQVVITFEKGESSMYAGIHLRMTGRLTWLPKGNVVEQPKGTFFYSNDRSYSTAAPRASFICTNGEIRFCDVRRFGTLKLCDEKSSFAPAGIEPLNRTLNKKLLKQLLGSSKQDIKAWLLRQDRIVGIGNIYASEILYDAQISPNRAAGSLTASETERLCRSIKSILRSAIAKCGTTFSDFQDSHGELGRYQSFLKVYKRESQACARCGEKIMREKAQGRSTFFCPKCQK